MAPAIKPVRVFKDIEQFALVHGLGTEAEFDADQKRIDELNKQEHKFQAWILSKTRQTPKRSEYLIVARPGVDGENKTPQQGEPAKLRVVFADGSVTRFWEARRVENPSFLGDIVRYHEKLATFKVTVHIAEAHDGVHPLMGTSTAPTMDAPTNPGIDTKSVTAPSDAVSSHVPDSGIGDSCLTASNTNPDSTTLSDDGGKIVLTSANAVRVNYLLSASEATKNAELEALDHLWGRHVNATERQIQAFKYFVLLRNFEFSVNLHEELPHLKGAMEHPTWPGSPLAKKFALLNPQQQAAYFYGFMKLPCGICILPGGPGAGKTHFNLLTIAMAQSEHLPRPIMVRGQLQKVFAKVLFIVDMNSPVDDVANRMMRLYKELDMDKIVIRMKGWGAEVKASDRLNAAEDAASGEDMQVDFTRQFLRAATAASKTHGEETRRSCEAPGLDEAAWQRYDQFNATTYAALAEYMESELWETSDVVPLRFRNMIYKLYRDTLASADFIATTPVAASNHFKGMFKPDLVYFDEAPHARELTNLTVIANFNPIAWIFCGDHRQTVPYVGSSTSESDNIYREQMQVSMMERAEVANAIPYQLLMNHRAFGDLHQLASTMWYRNKMVSGNTRTPESLSHVRDYLGKLAGGRPCTVPRLLVHLKNCGPEVRDGTSAWNPDHTAFVMARVLELLNNPGFKHPERDEAGKILIVSPYKGACHEYKRQVKALPPWAQRRVEARTVDVVQGHEADFVFLDLVKDKSTRFLDDANRLCVALTRARLGEIVMMHPGMVQSATFQRNSRNLRRIYDLCKQAGQVAHVNAETTPIVINQPAARTSFPGGKSPIANAASDTASTVSRPRTPVNPAYQALDHAIKVAPLPETATPSEDFTAVASAVPFIVDTKSAQKVAGNNNDDAFSMAVFGIKANVPLHPKTERITTGKSLTAAPCVVDAKPAEKVAGNGSNDAFSMAVFGIKANVPLRSKVESTATGEDSITVASAVPCITETKPAQKVTGNGSNDAFSMAVFGIKANVPLHPKTEKITIEDNSAAVASAVPCITETEPVQKVAGNGSNDAFSMAVFGIKANVPLRSKTENITTETIDDLTVPEQVEEDTVAVLEEDPLAVSEHAEEESAAVPEEAEEDSVVISAHIKEDLAAAFEQAEEGSAPVLEQAEPDFAPLPEEEDLATLPENVDDKVADCEPRNAEASAVDIPVPPCVAGTKPAQKIVDVGNLDAFSMSVFGIKVSVSLSSKTESGTNEKGLSTLPEKASKRLVDFKPRRAEASVMDTEIVPCNLDMTPTPMMASMAEEGVTQLPEGRITQLPEQFDTQLPEESITQLSKETDVQLPQEIDIQVPEESTTQLSKDIDVQLPEEMDTQVPEESTTQLSKDFDTQLPEATIAQISGIDTHAQFEKNMTSLANESEHALCEPREATSVVPPTAAAKPTQKAFDIDNVNPFLMAVFGPRIQVEELSDESITPEDPVIPAISARDVSEIAVSGPLEATTPVSPCQEPTDIDNVGTGSMATFDEPKVAQLSEASVKPKEGSTVPAPDVNEGAVIKPQEDEAHVVPSALDTNHAQHVPRIGDVDGCLNMVDHKTEATGRSDQSATSTENATTVAQYDKEPEAPKVKTSVVSRTVGEKHAQKVLNLDDGNGWWERVFGKTVKTDTTPVPDENITPAEGSTTYTHDMGDEVVADETAAAVAFTMDHENEAPTAPCDSGTELAQITPLSENITRNQDWTTIDEVVTYESDEDEASLKPCTTDSELSPHRENDPPAKDPINLAKDIGDMIVAYGSFQTTPVVIPSTMGHKDEARTMDHEEEAPTLPFDADTQLAQVTPVSDNATPEEQSTKLAQDIGDKMIAYDSHEATVAAGMDHEDQARSIDDENETPTTDHENEAPVMSRDTDTVLDQVNPVTDSIAPEEKSRRLAEDIGNEVVTPTIRPSQEHTIDTPVPVLPTSTETKIVRNVGDLEAMTPKVGENNVPDKTLVDNVGDVSKKVARLEGMYNVLDDMDDKHSNMDEYSNMDDEYGSMDKELEDMIKELEGVRKMVQDKRRKVQNKKKKAEDMVLGKTAAKEPERAPKKAEGHPIGF